MHLTENRSNIGDINENKKTSFYLQNMMKFMLEIDDIIIILPTWVKINF